MTFFLEVLINGLLVGIMYSLVALGFALIYKASDVFNFAQGAMSLLAGLALVGFLDDLGMPLWLALICTVGVMTLLAYGPAGSPPATNPLYGSHRVGLPC
jgi:branched-chain amino acid transport system permease protein